MNVGGRVSTSRGGGTVVRVDGGVARIRLDAGGEFEVNMGPVNMGPAASGPARRAARRGVGPRMSARATLCPGDLAIFSNPFVLGFLAASAVLTVEAPTGSKEAFMCDYASATGGSPWDDSCYCEFSDKWGHECRIGFIATDSMIGTLGLSVHAIRGRAGSFRINSNALWWELVSVGFRLGNRHDLERIAASMPTQDRASFNGGIDAALVA